MTVNFIIGELEIEVPDATDSQRLDCCDVRLSAVEVELPKGEGLQIPLGKANHADFSYNRWFNFCEEVGIRDVFYDKDENFIGRRTGAIWITPLTQHTIRAAYKALQAEYPDFVLQDVISSDHLVGHFHLLAWLDYWVTWALENCKRPVIHHS